MQRIATCALGLAFFCLIAFCPPVTYPGGDSIAGIIATWKDGYGSGFWPWSVQALNYNGDQFADLVITAHNGGSIVLENHGDGTWGLVDSPIESGTFRPVAFDFDGDGLDDLGFRDSLPNTFYRQVDSGFSGIGFAYGTGNDPIRQLGPGWFGHDWGKWTWDGSTFKAQSYTNPNYGKLPQPIKNQLGDHFGVPFFRAWFNETPGLVAITGWYSYHKAPNFCAFLSPRRGKLVDITGKLGLPSNGAVAYMDSELILIIGHGAYTFAGNGTMKIQGALTDFLAVRGDSPHFAYRAGDMLVVNNVRGRKTKVFRYGTWEQLYSVDSWDGEAVAFPPGDVNGDGILDIAIGSGETVVFVYGT